MANGHIGEIDQPGFFAKVNAAAFVAAPIAARVVVPIIPIAELPTRILLLGDSKQSVVRRLSDPSVGFSGF